MKQDDRILIIPDTHAPYHDKKAWELMLDVARDFKPTTICILGDFVDCHSISSHSKNPACTYSLADEIETASGLLKQLEALKPKRKIYCEGNHEERYPRVVKALMPALYDPTMNLRSKLNLDQRGWTWVPYRKHIKLAERFYATHDFGASGKGAALQAPGVYGSNVVFGHTHRLSVHVEGDVQHGTRFGANLGWLGDRSYVDYLHEIKQKDWQLAFGLATVEASTGYVFINPVPIIAKDGAYVTSVSGKTYTKKAK